MLAASGEPPHFSVWLGAIVLAATILAIGPAHALAGRSARAVRSRPGLAGFALLSFVTALLSVWIATCQPVWGRFPRVRELGLLLAIVWVALAVLTLGVRPGELAEMGARFAGRRASKILLASTTFVALLFVCEAALRVFMIQSDGFAVTIMHRQWMALHWRPVNSLGYRDREPVQEPDKRHVIVVGDSFAAGHGIERFEDTFAFVMERELGDRWRVHIAAKAGWATPPEYDALVRYPLKPDVIVLSYYINDVNYLLPEDVEKYASPGPALAWLVDNFFTASYVYWHAYRGGLSSAQDRYARNRIAAYDDPEVWSAHARDLVRFVALARQEDVKLIVLVWPRLDGVESSRPVTARVSELFRSQGVEVVDMTGDLAGREVRQIVVNRLDAHPNAAVHALVGKKLAEALRVP